MKSAAANLRFRIESAPVLGAFYKMVINCPLVYIHKL